MPSLSQFFGVKKGNNSPTSRQGFFPFSRKLSSAPSRGRQHLRTKSEIGAVCYSNGHNGTRFSDISKRTSPVVGNGYDYCESYESRYERYRQIYLATSPERELSTLNAAIVNVRKWLKKKHQCLQALQQQADSVQGLPSPGDNKSLLHLSGNVDTPQALLEKLVREAGHQQEAVDVLLDRGRRYLQQRACITLETDLDNLAYLWGAYTRQLFTLHDHPDQPLSLLPPPSTPTPAQGKENIFHHSTPVKWKKGGKVSTPHKLRFSDTLESRRSPGLSLQENGVLHSVSKSLSSSFAGFDPTCEFALSASLRSDIDFDQEKEDCSAVQSSSDADVTDSPVRRENREEGEEKINQEIHIQEASEIKAKEVREKSPEKAHCKLPQLPPVNGVFEAQESEKPQEQTTSERKDSEVEKKIQDQNSAQSQATEEEKRNEETGEKKKKTSPRSPRSKVIAASQWPTENGKKGWLSVAGEGIFTNSSRWPRRPNSLTTSSASEASADSSPDLSPSQRSKGVVDCVEPRAVESDSDCGREGLLGKRGKEIHNEQQQKQERQQQEELLGDSEGSQQNGPHSPSPPPHSPISSGLQLQLGLTASEENLRMEIEHALREINGSLNDAKGDITATDSTTSDSLSASDTNVRTSDNDDDPDPDLPTEPKRRRLNLDGLGWVSSGSGSPLVSADSSMTATPTSSPAGTLPRDFRQRYKKDELWRAIKSDYQYLMDKEIIETCQSTETALTGEGEEEEVPSVSFTEFLKQYQELIDWLNQTQRNTQRTLTSLSEKYLNQTYHEELLAKCPRRELLTRYSQQLLGRYPHLAPQVTSRMQRLHATWALVEAALAPQPGEATAHSMRQDLECDLSALRRWLNATESLLLPLTIRADWTDAELEDRLRAHQALQQDIESHSRIVSAVLKLSERLEREASCPHDTHNPHDTQSLQLAALTLERRWHGIWLQSLEWQCRLEEAINRRKGLYGSGINFSGFTLPTLDESGAGGCSAGSDLDLDLPPHGPITTSSNGSLIELSDDSLLFIGTRSERHVGGESTDSGPASPCLSLTSPTTLTSSPKLINFLDRSSGDSANISECESKMGDSPRGAPPLPPEGVAEPNSGMGGEGSPEVRGVRMMKVPQESKDIGYSSESQSNDETESMQQQIALECRYAGIIEVCSDSLLGEKMTLPTPGAVRPDYYCMTHVELDSTTDKTTTDDGNTTDDKENHSCGVSGGEGQSMVTLASQGVPKAAVVNLLQGSGSNLSPRGSREDIASSPRGSREDITVKSYLESSDEVEGAEAALLPEDRLPPCSLSESDSTGDCQEKIRYLIDHAEDLVKTSPRSPGVPGSPQRKSASPSKQTQTSLMETSSVESSCDASSENSDESGNEEFSTATDDADDTLFDSVINLNATMDSLVSREDVPLTVDPARLRKQTGPRGGGKKDRPWSVAGVQGLKKTDFQPLSTSESAIDRMRAHTDTDSSSCQFISRAHASTFPRHRGYQRAFSACEHSSPRATKRKLKYSSSSSATDSQASRSSATQVAASTEDEDDKTFLYDSAEQLRSSQCMPSCLLESESETTDEYLTASMDEVITSADEDPHNSTGSFSENAWDNYQMMYPTASEDATEEVLHWEPVDDMEFDDDFNLTSPHRSSLLSEAISKRANKMRLKGMRSGEDSDSDMEDFRSVLEDSETCLKVVDHSLRKKRNNPMGSGLAAPGKYAEILATCQTNMDCVKNVCQHLTQEDIGIGDVQRVQQLLYRWGELHAMASDRLQQSQQLGVVGEAVTAMRAALSSVDGCLAVHGFASKEQLRSTINTLRVKEEELEKQRQVIEEHRQVITAFLTHHPSVNVTKYLQELQALDQATTHTLHKVQEHVQGLETNFTVWCEYLEGQQELDTLMTADRERMYTLLGLREAGHRVTRMDVLKELETLQSNLSLYESKLAVLQALQQRLMRVSDDKTRRSFLASLADLRNQLHVVTQRCREMYRDVEGEEDMDITPTPILGHLAMAPASLLECRDPEQTRSVPSRYTSPAAMEEGGGGYRPLMKQGGAWRWLRSVPVQVVALIMVAGLIYVLDPDLLAQLASFSLTVDPEVRHENGPSGQ